MNPLVYASEGLRDTLVPQYPHLTVLAALSLFDLLQLAAGFRQFQRQAVS